MMFVKTQRNNPWLQCLFNMDSQGLFLWRLGFHLWLTSLSIESDAFLVNFYCPSITSFVWPFPLSGKLLCVGKKLGKKTSLDRSVYTLLLSSSFGLFRTHDDFWEIWISMSGWYLWMLAFLAELYLCMVSIECILRVHWYHLFLTK